MQDIREIKECPDCASSNIVHNVEREQVVCRECGLIYEPLTPEEEERFEETHDLTMPRPKAAVKTAKAKPKAAKAKKRK
jgi:transcription initiation factor TFIIIB Brf1 subunit/transcription initiation factor TFIIB